MGKQLRQLERSTVETWASVALGLGTQIIHMTWGWELVLFGVMYVLVADIAIRSSWTIRLWWPAKAALLVGALALLVAAAGDSITQKFYEGGGRDAVPLPIAGLTLADYYLDQRRVYLLLSAIVLVLVFWRFAPVARFRHTTVFVLRRSVAEQVWISQDKALAIVRESVWAQERKRADEPSTSATSQFSLIWQPQVKTQSEAVRARKFTRWCARALEKFSTRESESVRDSGNTREYDEVVLRQYLEEKYDDDVDAEFGAPY